MQLNDRAAALVDALLPLSDELRIDYLESECGAQIIDCGIRALGGLRAGCALAEVSLADLGHVSVCQAIDTGRWGPRLQIVTDHPVLACLASQYAGWKASYGKFFAMLSGPIRAAAAKEAIFNRADVAAHEVAEVAVGVMETRQFPNDEICRDLARQAAVEPEALILLIAPTASMAGTVQVVARTVETAVHKLAELGFDLGHLISGHGVAPIPPQAKNDMAAIGRTNDAILYGGEVTLWVAGGDDEIERLGPQVPSSASPDFGRPFAEIFEAAGYDFYKIDPHLFSPALINFISLETGRLYRYGAVHEEILERSFTK